MKTCGYCGNEYDEKEQKCPRCGSTLLKHTKGAKTAEEERERLKEEIIQKRKVRSLILVGGAVAIILVVVLIISSIVRFINDPQRKIAKESKALMKQAEKMVDDCDYDSAIDTLDQINSEWEDYSTTKSVRQEAERGLLMDQIGEYQDAENYEELLVFIDENVPDTYFNAKIQAIYEEATQKCKDNTLAAIAQYTEAGDYLGAIQYIDCLGSSMKTDDDIKSLYNQAVANYESSVISEAEAFTQAGDYTSARSVLSIAENYLGKSDTLGEKIAEINEREVTAQVLSYAEASNYQDAIICLNKNSEIVAGSQDLQTKLSTYTEKYRANIFNEAASAYEMNGYEAAISVLNTALKVLPNDNSINEEKVRYEAAIPVPLTDLDVTKRGEEVRIGKYYGWNFEKDVNGNTYPGSGVHYVYSVEESAEDIEKRSITYYLKQDYDVFTGIMYRPYITLSCWFEWEYDANVKIYGDGVLLYGGSISQDSFDAIPFTVEVTGVRELTIELPSQWREEKRTSDFYDWYPKACLAELKVAKKP